MINMKRSPRKREIKKRSRDVRLLSKSHLKGGAIMRYLKLTLAALAIAAIASQARADEYRYRGANSPDIDIWTNKGEGATYYYGEDVAIYFRAERDCYMVVYDIDPSGNVNILFPTNYYNSPYVEGDRVYRIPDYYSDYTLEVSSRSGTEHIFAVASYDYINPPDFMQYIDYDYGNPDYYEDGYFITKKRGDTDDFVHYVNDRIVNGPYSVSHTRFYVESTYRHHRHYRYWDYDPYYVGSVWVGCNYPGSEIWIDGIYYGIAPILIPRLIFGQHWVWVYYGGYPCYQSYFYLSSSDRYYIDVRVDDRYKDYRYRRNSFGGWHPLEKQYRNEGDFDKRAREARDAKHIRAKALPAHVVRDFDKRGIIKKGSPLDKQVRSESRIADDTRMVEKRKERAKIENESKKRETNTEKPDYQAIDPRGIKRVPSSTDVKPRQSDERYDYSKRYEKQRDEKIDSQKKSESSKSEIKSREKSRETTIKQDKPKSSGSVKKQSKQKVNTESKSRQSTKTRSIEKKSSGKSSDKEGRR